VVGHQTCAALATEFLIDNQPPGASLIDDVLLREADSPL
jgi:hypothetical protein